MNLTNRLLSSFIKMDDLNDPLITEDHIKLLHLAEDNEINILKEGQRSQCISSINE